jgi:hypothetical protein
LFSDKCNENVKRNDIRWTIHGRWPTMKEEDNMYDEEKYISKDEDKNEVLETDR